MRSATDLERLRGAAVARDQAVDDVAKFALSCHDQGVLQKDIAEAAGRTREWVRQLVLKHRGVDESA